MANQNTSTKKDLSSFEDKIQQLEQIANNLNTSNLELEKALELFNQGAKLNKQCQDILNNAEQQIHQILDTQNSDSGA